MSDITERLRDLSRRGYWPLIGDEAADLIEVQAEKIRVLREALADAIECVQDWGLYASPYFIEKHDLNGDVKRLRAALEAAQ